MREAEGCWTVCVLCVCVCVCVCVCEGMREGGTKGEREGGEENTIHNQNIVGKECARTEQVHVHVHVHIILTCTSKFH